MSNIKYVIRNNDFAYNDEYFLSDDATLGKIHTIYDSKAAAELTWRALVVKELRFYGLFRFGLFMGDGELERLAALDAFVVQACGQSFDDDNDYSDENYSENSILEALSDDEVFEFAQLSGIMHYQLVEFDTAKPMYAVWFYDEQDYLRNEEFRSLSYGSDEDFIEHDKSLWLLSRKFFQPINGTLQDLTDSPQLLDALMRTTAGITYDVEQQALIIREVHSIGYKNLKALNALLKQPFFEIRPLTLEQIQAL